MKFHTFGTENLPAVLLIHGMGCDAKKSFSVLIHELEKSHYVLAVDLDGHDRQNTTFTSVQNQAEKVAAYLNEHDIHTLYAVLGMSLGGFIAMDLICRCGVSTEKFIYDSGYVPPMPCKRALSCTVAWGFERLIQGKAGPIIRMGMKALMGYCFTKEQLCASASRRTIYNVEYSCMNYQLPDNLSRLNQKNTMFLYGEKEKTIIRGMRVLKKRLPKMQTICMGTYGHGELMFKAPERYTQRVIDCLRCE